MTRSSPAEPTLLKMHTARDALEERNKKGRKKEKRRVGHEEAGDWLVMYSECSLNVLPLSCPLDSQHVSTHFLEPRCGFYPSVWPPKRHVVFKRKEDGRSLWKMMRTTRRGKKVRKTIFSFKLKFSSFELTFVRIKLIMSKFHRKRLSTKMTTF